MKESLRSSTAVAGSKAAEWFQISALIRFPAITNIL